MSLVPLPFLLVVLFLLLSPSPCSSSLSYLGCYSDVADIQHRTLHYVYENTPSMNIGECAHFCGGLGFPYSGVEYKSECYCGKDAPLDSLRLNEDKCPMECAKIE